MSAWTQILKPGPALLILFLAVAAEAVNAAPLDELDQSTEIEYYPVADATGCYYNFEHYDEGDRIITNEPCLNCTCHNRMLMCYLRVCPFTKAIGQDCKVEKRPDQCCPVITCPEVPVHLLPQGSTTPSTAVGHLNEYGCSIDNLFYADGAKVPSNPNNPCEVCYCIRNKTACIIQECTLTGKVVEGCRPVYVDGVCCPVRYDCDHPELETTPRPLLTTTTTTLPPTSAPTDCIYNNEVYADGALVKKDVPCEQCYCMRGDIVCAVQECGPTPLDKVNCTALPTKEGQCCPDTYECENISEEDLTTLTYYEVPTTQPTVLSSTSQAEGQYPNETERQVPETITEHIESSAEKEPLETESATIEPLTSPVTEAVETITSRITSIVEAITSILSGSEQESTVQPEIESTSTEAEQSNETEKTHTVEEQTSTEGETKGTTLSESMQTEKESHVTSIPDVEELKPAVAETESPENEQEHIITESNELPAHDDHEEEPSEDDNDIEGSGKPLPTATGAPVPEEKYTKPGAEVPITTAPIVSEVTVKEESMEEGSGTPFEETTASSSAHEPTLQTESHVKESLPPQVITEPVLIETTESFEEPRGTTQRPQVTDAEAQETVQPPQPEKGTEAPEEQPHLITVQQPEEKVTEGSVEGERNVTIGTEEPVKETEEKYTVPPLGQKPKSESESETTVVTTEREEILYITETSAKGTELPESMDHVSETITEISEAQVTEKEEEQQNTTLAVEEILPTEASVKKEEMETSSTPEKPKEEEGDEIAVKPEVDIPATGKPGEEEVVEVSSESEVATEKPIGGQEVTTSESEVAPEETGKPIDEQDVTTSEPQTEAPEKVIEEEEIETSKSQTEVTEVAGEKEVEVSTKPDQVTEQRPEEESVTSTSRPQIMDQVTEEVGEKVTEISTESVQVTVKQPEQENAEPTKTEDQVTEVIGQHHSEVSTEPTQATDKQPGQEIVEPTTKPDTDNEIIEATGETDTGISTESDQVTEKLPEQEIIIPTSKPKTEDQVNEILGEQETEVPTESSQATEKQPEEENVEPTPKSQAEDQVTEVTGEEEAVITTKPSQDTQKQPEQENVAPTSRPQTLDQTTDIIDEKDIEVSTESDQLTEKQPEQVIVTVEPESEVKLTEPSAEKESTAVPAETFETSTGGAELRPTEKIAETATTEKPTESADTEQPINVTQTHTEVPELEPANKVCSDKGCETIQGEKEVPTITEEECTKEKCTPQEKHPGLEAVTEHTPLEEDTKQSAQPTGEACKTEEGCVQSITDKESPAKEHPEVTTEYLEQPTETPDLPQSTTESSEKQLIEQPEEHLTTIKEEAQTEQTTDLGQEQETTESSPLETQPDTIPSQTTVKPEQEVQATEVPNEATSQLPTTIRNVEKTESLDLESDLSVSPISPEVTESGITTDITEKPQQEPTNIEVVKETQTTEATKIDVSQPEVPSVSDESITEIITVKGQIEPEVTESTPNLDVETNQSTESSADSTEIHQGREPAIPVTTEIQKLSSEVTTEISKVSNDSGATEIVKSDTEKPTTEPVEIDGLTNPITEQVVVTEQSHTTVLSEVKPGEPETTETVIPPGPTEQSIAEETPKPNVYEEFSPQQPTTISTEVPEKTEHVSTETSDTGVPQVPTTISSELPGKTEHVSIEVGPTESAQQTTEPGTPAVSITDSESEVGTTSEPEEHGIPGEGSCLVDGQTYKNNSNVPPINQCQTSCKCVSSILQCDSIPCTPPPNNLQCSPVFLSSEACCPIYSCSVPGVTSMESDSHVVETTTTGQDEALATGSISSVEPITSEPTTEKTEPTEQAELVTEAIQHEIIQTVSETVVTEQLPAKSSEENVIGESEVTKGEQVTTEKQLEIEPETVVSVTETQPKQRLPSESQTIIPDQQTEATPIVKPDKEVPSHDDVENEISEEADHCGSEGCVPVESPESTKETEITVQVTTEAEARLQQTTLGSITEKPQEQATPEEIDKSKIPSTEEVLGITEGSVTDKSLEIETEASKIGEQEEVTSIVTEVSSVTTPEWVTKTPEEMAAVPDKEEAVTTPSVVSITDASFDEISPKGTEQITLSGEDEIITEKQPEVLHGPTVASAIETTLQPQHTMAPTEGVTTQEPTHISEFDELDTTPSLEIEAHITEKIEQEVPKDYTTIPVTESSVSHSTSKLHEEIATVAVTEEVPSETESVPEEVVTEQIPEFEQQPTKPIEEAPEVQTTTPAIEKTAAGSEKEVGLDEQTTTGISEEMREKATDKPLPSVETEAAEVDKFPTHAPIENITEIKYTTQVTEIEEATTVSVQQPEKSTEEYLTTTSVEEVAVSETEGGSVPEKQEPIYTSPELTTQSSINISEPYTSGPKEEISTKKSVEGELSTSVPLSSVSTSEPTTTTPSAAGHSTPGEQVPELPEYTPPEDYEDEEESPLGPGTCRYGGKVYVSAQQIPRDNPCDFCFCFRSDIICLQQSCPPVIPGCNAEIITGFCCPRFECPVGMATSVNVTTSTTTTTTTLPPHFLPHAYRGRLTKSGCLIKGRAYQVGEAIPSVSGPCLQCKCGSDGEMQCDPKHCDPQPMLSQIIAAAESRRRR